MSDRMYPRPFGRIMETILDEYQAQGHICGVLPQAAPPESTAAFLGQPLEAPFGPAAGPHTQLAGNLIAAYAAGARFFELKTVQMLDGEDLVVAKPCILAEDECYNVEWSTELTVSQAAAEYIKAWFAIQLLARELELGDPEAFQFNMSVGYDLAGIRQTKMDGFIEVMKNAAPTAAWKECREWALANLSRFQKVDASYVQAISPQLCRSVTVSTLHGCPPQEIEAIASYLLTEKNLHTFVKCNPTLLGYADARQTLDKLGFDYLVFDDSHFRGDLQFADAVPMIERLLALAGQRGLIFGVKLTNTMPVTIDNHQLPGEEMYLSGRALYPLTIQVAQRLSAAFQGNLPISFTGGVDARNAAALYQAGLRPLTLATSLLKPGGYQRLSQIGRALAQVETVPAAVDTAALAALAENALSDSQYQKPQKLPVKRKIAGPPPQFDCFAAPCRDACPLHQDVPAYLAAVAEGDMDKALRIILERNPLPHITGAICPHTCMDQCNRRFYELPVDIRGCKLLAAEQGLVDMTAELAAVKPVGKKAAVVGGGPAGLAAAVLLRRAGWEATIIERTPYLGGIVRRVIPDFRIESRLIDADIQMVKAAGVKVVTEQLVTDVRQLRQSYDAVFVAVGAGEHGYLKLDGKAPLNALEFLAQFKAGKVQDLGDQICVVGGGNSAMDAARAALRLPGDPHVTIVYRRDQRNMPADEEELTLARQEGVEFRELLNPVSWRRRSLVCEQMELGNRDDSGRRHPVGTGLVDTVECSGLIAAVGERVDAVTYRRMGLNLDPVGYPQLDEKLCNGHDIYVIGDSVRGPSTVASAIGNALTAVEAATGHRFDRYFAANSCYTGRAPRGVLAERQSGCEEASRCLECAGFCANCVESCPNRANVLVEVEGRQQVLHLDELCNECGNCAVFCPYEGRPYRDKITQFTDMDSFRASENDGFIAFTDCNYLLRIKGEEYQYDVTQAASLAELMELFLED